MKEHEFDPFERVLVREEDNRIWRIDFFNSMRNQLYGDELYVCLAGAWHQCVPYEGNEHLLGTTDDPTPPEPEFKFGDKVEVRESNKVSWLEAVYIAKAHSGHSVMLKDCCRISDWFYCRHADW